MGNKLWMTGALVAALGVMPAAAQWRQVGSSGTAGTQNPRANGPVMNGPSNGPGNGPGYSSDMDGDGRNDVGVARVSVADGDVEVLRESGDRMQARGGMPLMSHDTISTARASRAEVQLGPGNLVRLNEDTRLRVLDIGNRFYRVEVLTGDVSITQFKGMNADITVIAGNANVRPLKAGIYRVVVRENIQTDLTVRKGEAELASGRDSEVIKSGKRATVRGDRQSAELRVQGAGDKDGFDRWNERRDDVLEPNTGGRGAYYGGVGYGYPWGWGGWGGYGYPFWGSGFYGGYGYGFGPTVIVGGRIGGGGFHGGGRGGGGRGGGRR